MHWEVVQPSFLEGQVPGSGLCWVRLAVEGGNLPPTPTPFEDSSQDQ